MDGIQLHPSVTPNIIHIVAKELGLCLPDLNFPTSAFQFLSHCKIL